MPSKPQFNFCLGLLALCCAVQAEENCPQGDLAAALQLTSGASYTAAAPELVRNASELFGQHFRQISTPQDEQASWQKLGFDVAEICEGTSRWWLIHEPTDTASGRGAYVFRANSESQLVLQAPHRHADWGTGRLAIAWLREENIRALALNTAPRRRAGEVGDGDADLAHTQISVLQAFTQAQARALPGSRLLQLHGFSRDKRRSAQGRKANVILSAGRSHVSAPVQLSHSCLYQRFGSDVRLFPASVRELGGTRNRQGQLFRQLAQDGFIHLELSREWRERLLANATFRHDVITCLVD